MNHTIFLGGTIITCGTEANTCEALVIENGKILATGSKQDILNDYGNGATIRDLQGAVLIPSFYDGHSHIETVATNLDYVSLESPPVGSISSIDDCLRTIRQFIQTAELNGSTPGLCCAVGFTESGMKEQRELTRHDLDLVSTEWAILVLERSIHMCYVNSKALELLGITAQTPDPQGGVIEREPESLEPNGILREEAMRNAMGEFKKINPAFGRVSPQNISKATALYASVGVTTANEGAFMTAIDPYLDAERNGMLHTRINLHPFYPARNIPVQDYLDWAESLQKKSSGWIRVAAIKHMYDGTLQNQTAYLSQPYYCAKADCEYPCGLPAIPKERLLSDIREIHRRGNQILVHCNGDRAIDDVLDAFAQALAEFPTSDPRHCIIHAQTIREDQIDRAKDLGVFLSLFPPHIYYFGDRHKDTFLGAERAERLSPAASLEKRGISFSIHCDTPVFPQNPLQTIWTAVNRLTYEGQILGRDQCVSPEEALKAYTIYAAYQHHEDQEHGSLEAGKFADMVILDMNPLTCDPMRIKDIQVMETIVEGKTTFRKSDGQFQQR